MSITEVAAVVWRRAPLFLLCMVLGIGSGLYAVSRVDPDYEARATVLLVDSSVDNAVHVNPFVELSSSLSTAARITASRLNDRTTLLDLKGAGLTGAPEVLWDADDKQPIIRLLVTDSDPKRANKSLSLLIEDMEAWLAATQAADGVSPDALVTANVVQRKQVADQGARGVRRALAVIVAVTLGISLWVCLAVDRWLRERRIPQAARSAVEASEGSTGGDDSATPDRGEVLV